MGLSDRDYMHERHGRGIPFGHKKAKARGIPRGGFRWMLWLVPLGLATLVLSFGSKALMMRGEEPFPPSGVPIWYVRANNPEAEFTISAPDDTQRLYVVRLDDEVTGQSVVLIPLRGGETHQVKVPFGRFHVTMASGTTWYGPERLFGTFAEHMKGVEPFHFYQSEGTIYGKRLELRKRLDGNMPTRAALPFEK
jgi:hypothetical protein